MPPGGVPFLTSWKRRHRDGSKIVAICDVSGSVAQVSDFFLLLIHSLHEVVEDVRSFAFSGHLIEVSEILDTRSPEEAMREIMSKVGLVLPTTGVHLWILRRAGCGR